MAGFYIKKNHHHRTHPTLTRQLRGTKPCNCICGGGIGGGGGDDVGAFFKYSKFS